MNNRFFVEKKIKNARVERPVSPFVFVRLAIYTTVGVLLVWAFLVSGSQHIESINLGYETEQLRRQSNELIEQVRKYDLERARYMSPVVLEQQAKAIGMKRPVRKVNAIRRPAVDGQ